MTVLGGCWQMKSRDALVLAIVIYLPVWFLLLEKYLR